MANKRNNITQAELRDILDYDPATGVLTNKKARPHAPVGARAGSVDYQGYRFVKIKGVRYVASRLIWLWMTDAWPECEVDHINLIRDDDRFINLRAATRSENCANKGRFYKKNSLGYRGVRRNTKEKFSAVLCIGQKEIYLGSYSSLEIAALAYDVAAKKHHKKFARFNFPERAHRDWLIL